METPQPLPLLLSVYAMQITCLIIVLSLRAIDRSHLALAYSGS
jgi:hypothetical protein